MALAAAAAAAGAAAGLQVDEEMDPDELDLSVSESSSSDDSEDEEEREEPDTPDRSAALPYLNIYDTQPFDEASGHLYLAQRPVTAAISYYEHIATSSFLSPYLYFITLRHGSFKWIVTKTYTQFAQLHRDLNLYRAKLKLQRGKKPSKLPRFPRRPDSLLRDFIQVENRKRILEKYIQNLLKITLYREHPNTVRFLEVSRLSFLDGLGPKFQEGMIKKLLDIQSRIVSCSGLPISQWKGRWLVLNDTYLTYLRPETGVIGDVLLMDKDFSVKHGRNETGINHGLFLSNSSRTLKAQCMSSRKCQIWHKNIQKVVKGTGSQFTNKNMRYHSFAPERANTRVSWFVDGASYLSAVADALERAKEEIFITDWKISPDIFLKAETRNDGTKWRLDEILKRRVEAGVHVFILIYKELPGTVALNSKQAKATFMEIDKELGTSNVHVMRHPDGLTNMKWSHHEKCVVIDQKTAFVGGLDLCDGRWDTSDHLLYYNVHEPGGERFERLAGVVMAFAKVRKSAENNAKANRVYKRSLTVPETSDELEKITLPVEPTIKEDEESSSSDDDAEENVAPSGRIYYSPSDSEDEIIKDDGQESCIPQQNPPANLVLSYSESNKNDVHKVSTDNVAPSKTQNGQNEAPLNQTEILSDICNGNQNNAPEANNGQTSPNRKPGKLSRQPKFFKQAFLQRQQPLNSDDKQQLQRSASATETTSLIPNGRRKFAMSFSKLREELKKNPQRKSTSDVVDDPTTIPEKNELSHLYEKLRAHPGDILSQLEFVIHSGERWAEFVGDEEMRMPWHDVGSVVYGKAARDVGRHFIQRWNFTRKEKEKLKKTFYPILVPKTYCKVTIPKSCLNKSYICNCQVLRSSDKWSAGIRETESSIHNAYESVILNAKHYIYIENQFFVTCSEHPDLQNRIASALATRIIRAHNNNETFRVYVVLPLMPVVKGKAEENVTPSVQVICYWTYESISRSENSIMKKLEAAGVRDPSKYISFYGLRKWYDVRGQLTSTLVYVHSKLLIADDRTVIMGSANINDRSMLGTRDSELAIVFDDTQFFTSKMNSEPYEAGNFATTLRRFLFKEHLGIKRDDSATDLKDPVCESFYKHVWMKTAELNTSIYEKVFRCLPSNKVRSFQGLDDYKKEATMAEVNPEAAKKLLTDQVNGQLVAFPLDFLVDNHDDLKVPPLTAKERLVPTDVWI